MFGHIMVPLDGSALAERALPIATQVARMTGATLHLVQVVEGIEPAEREHAHTYLEAVRPAAVTTITAVPNGSAAAALLDYEEDAGINLVVLCSRGRGGLTHVVLGSVADRLLRHGTAPLLLVRAMGPSLSLDRAVVPLDGSAHAEQAIEVLVPLAGTAVREVTLLRMIATAAEQQEAERYLTRIARRLPASLTVRCCVEQGDPVAHIGAMAGAEGFVMMATHGRIGMTRWALGSVADRVVHCGAAGVLLLRWHASDAATVGGQWEDRGPTSPRIR